MEYKEALEYLKIMRKFFTNDDDEGKVLKQAYDVAIKACKKQIQKKPMFKTAEQSNKEYYFKKRILYLPKLWKSVGYSKSSRR